MLPNVGVDLAAAEMPKVDQRVGQGFERVLLIAGFSRRSNLPGSGSWLGF